MEPAKRFRTQWIPDGQPCWQDPSRLSPFSLLLYGDLKKYVFYYWFAFPAFNVPSSMRVQGTAKLSEEYDEGLGQDIVQEFRHGAGKSTAGILVR
jgi:hypothetical protein